MMTGINRKTILLGGAAVFLISIYGFAGKPFAQDHDGHDHAPVSASAQVEIKPGNPVVAIVSGVEVKRSDVQSFIDKLPEQMKQMPATNLFMLARDQVVTNKIIDTRAASAGAENNPEVLKTLAEAKEQIIRQYYVESEIKKEMTDQRLQDAYKKAFGEPAEEVRARHILVDTEEKAKEIIKKLDKGEKFEDLAKANSADPGSGAEGGDLGYFTKDKMVPEFSEAAFKLKPGKYTKSPVKSQFGWHIIKLEDRRKQEPPKFEAVKPKLESDLRNEIIMGMIDKWEKESGVKKFDINGEPIAEEKK